MTAAVERVRRYFEQVSPDALSRLGEIYTDDAYFKDPFNEVRGVDRIRKIFDHMFVQLADPRFVIRDTVAQGADAFLTWDFRFRLRRFRDTELVIHGASHLRFTPDGRVCFHRDYWDAAEELYEKLPVLGGLMRWLKRRAVS